jgi:carboxymethylenebutenolidase
MGKMIEIKADKVIDAYLAQTKATPKGAIIVIHEVWGLVDQTKSVADRLAEEGYIALAPSLIEYPDLSSAEISKLQLDLFDEKKRTEIQPVLRRLTAPIHDPEFGKLTTARVSKCFDYLYDLPEANQKVAIIGFCFGGSYSFSLAVSEPRLKISLPFYGHADQSIEELQKINCPVRAYYGENDERLMSDLDDLKNRMTEAGVDFDAKVYPNCGHAFFNDTNPNAYNKEASEEAWKQVKKELSEVM